MRHFSKGVSLVDFSPRDPRLMSIAEQIAQLRFIGENLQAMKFPANAFEFAENYAQQVMPLLELVLQQATVSSLTSPQLVPCVGQLLRNSKMITPSVGINLLADIIFDCPDAIPVLQDCILATTRMPLDSEEQINYFVYLAVNYARVSITREVEDLTHAFEAKITYLYSRLNDRLKIKVCWFYIYSTQGSQVYLLTSDFLARALACCAEYHISASALETSLENCYEFVAQLKSNGFQSSYFAFAEATPQQIHGMLTGSNGEQQRLALEIIMAQKPYLPLEDYQLVWMLLLLVRARIPDDEFDFLCENLRYLELIDTFLRGV